MQLSRRTFLKRGALALVSIGSVPMWGPSFLQQLVFAAEPTRAGGRKVLICLFQRGAVDGLSMVIPYGDKHYYEARSDIAIAPPTQKAGAEGVLDLDGFFGFHPNMAALLPIYKSGHLALIQACGSPSSTRSHFDAQDFMECGVVSDKSIRTGWLNRTLLACPEDRAKITSFRAVALTAMLPRSLQGEYEALAIPDLKSFGVRGAQGLGHGVSNVGTADGFEGMYEGAVDSVMHGTGKEAFDAIAALQSADPTKYLPQNGAQYPNSAFGRALMQIAQMIKADLGVEVAFAEIGGWDTHVNQGGAAGQLANRFTEFSKSLAALYQDLGDRLADVVILTMSEFGRTVRQNGNRGTDHGHANCFMVMGGPVRGGKVYGRWPGLAQEQLYQGRDLALTTDYRDVFTEIAQKHLGARELPKIFPEFALDPNRYHGLIRT
ncbi:MAG TPA: DUF1501 domain-containing protein [Verrucomicrobiae bacterium]|nr:DUF1501 domain-containing protein [Verrucomicrobiae bacterium]